jgi:hypothetical protein
MSDKTITEPTTTSKKLQIKKDTLRQLGPDMDPGQPMLTGAICTYTALNCCPSGSSGHPCC